MIAAGVLALVVGLVVLVLFTGYCYGRAETEQHYRLVIEELEATIDALLPTGVKVLP